MCLPSLQGTRHAAFCHTRPCGFVHQGQSCNGNMATFLPRAYLRALPVYLPVYFLPAILVHRRRLLDTKAGPEILGKVGTCCIAASAGFGAVSTGLSSRCLWITLLQCNPPGSHWLA